MIWTRIFSAVFLLTLNAVAQSPADSTISGLRVKVISLNRQDETFLDLTPGRDSVAIPKLDNPGITLAIGTSVKRYSIAGLAIAEDAGIVPFNLRRAGSLNQMILKKTGPQTAFYAMFLKDDAEGTITYLEEDSVQFDFAATSNDQERFSLLIQSSATGKHKAFSPGFSCPLPYADEIPLKAYNSEEIISISDLCGKSCLNIVPSGKSGFSTSSLPAGIYLMPAPDKQKNCLIIRK